jgi:hypothetical protein
MIVILYIWLIVTHTLIHSCVSILMGLRGTRFFRKDSKGELCARLLLEISLSVFICSCEYLEISDFKFD